MKKCDCYIEKQVIRSWPISTTEPRCNGTREQDICSCGGDRTKCDFYPEVREKALKEREPKLGKWISVKDRLPKKDQEILVYRGHHSGLMNVYTYIGDNEWEDDYGYWGRTDDEGITHWMLLPAPPTEKEN